MGKMPAGGEIDVKIGVLRRTYRRISEQMRRSHIGVFAASSAFYCFLSLVPLVILLLNLIPYTELSRETVRQVFFNFTPEPFQELVDKIIREVYTGSPALLSISALLELWSAAMFLSSLMQGIREIYDGYSDEGYFHLKLLGILYTIVLIVFILIDISLFAFGEKLCAVIESKAPSLYGAWCLLLRTRGVVFLLGLTAYNALLFKTIPRRELRFRRQLPGAAFSAVAWFAFSQLFSWLIDQFSIFSTYGSLSIIVISLFWLYYSVYILFLGAFLNTLPITQREPPKRSKGSE